MENRGAGRPLLLLTTHFNLSLMFRVCLPPFSATTTTSPPSYFLAGRLILIVAIEHSTLFACKAASASMVREALVVLGAVHSLGLILMVLPLPPSCSLSLSILGSDCFPRDSC